MTRKERRQRERRVLYRLTFAIENFDEKVPDMSAKELYELTGDIHNRPGKPKAFYFLRTQSLLPILTMYRKVGKITLQQQDALIDQLNSVDREDWYVAFVIIKQLISKPC